MCKNLAIIFRGSPSSNRIKPKFMTLIDDGSYSLEDSLVQIHRGSLYK